ncbi:CDP-glycerol glycerophosphotransferase family protein [Treponema parvum]|uniref:CDP-glycerol glycerophosphotransferase family protein n=1 Tax=Treponema parvum TaxID=138851 RepID=A0A975IDK8_9SPIR|nr:CDP-glycerol glycerophosphotransferase family protein [Treponema parvum]QTQ12883.1 CDP-glycerol glycerophosphotransferase family protein [Treponema parvum]QTQ17392.1 CDP-glycerol glycerophosphotransferase family protein [Treponema parvum]
MYNFLYIDPGTGSMLFSILIGACATLYFLFKAFWIKLKIFITGGKAQKNDKAYKKYVIYSEDKRYWNVFKPILDDFENRKIDITYYVATESDPVFAEKYEYVHPEVIGEGNKAFAKLNMLSAGFVLMSTPGLQVYQLKRSKNVKHYSHIFHSPGDPTMYRLFGIDYFDSILCTGDYQFNDIREMEKQRNLPAKTLLTVGCTYLDVFKQKIEKLPNDENHKFTVLVSPSWGKSALLSKYGKKLLEPLVNTGWNIIIRPHPQSKISEKEMLKELQECYKDTPNVEWDSNSDNFYSLKKADIMITDFSGIIWDYTFLCDKPVMYANAEMDLAPYDAYDIDHEIWQFETVKKIGIKVEEKDFANIKEIIQNASDSPKLSEERKKAKEQAWMFIGEAGKRTADFMIKTMEEANT